MCFSLRSVVLVIDDPGPARKAGEHLGGLRECGVDLVDPLGDLGLDLDPLVRAQFAHVQQRIDEEAQALVGGQATSGGVRRVDQPQVLEILHDVAHRGR